MLSSYLLIYPKCLEVYLAYSRHLTCLLSQMNEPYKHIYSVPCEKKKACHKIILAFKVAFCGFTSTLYITYVLNICSFKRKKKWKNIYQSINRNFYPLVNTWLHAYIFFSLVYIFLVIVQFLFVTSIHKNALPFIQSN